MSEPFSFAKLLRGEYTPEERAAFFPKPVKSEKDAEFEDILAAGARGEDTGARVEAWCEKYPGSIAPGFHSTGSPIWRALIGLVPGEEVVT